MIQQGVHVFVRVVVGRDMTDQHFVGADSKKTLEAAIEQVPPTIRADLRKQMRDVVEGTAKHDRFGIIKAAEVSDGVNAHAWIWVRAVEVVS